MRKLGFFVLALVIAANVFLVHKPSLAAFLIPTTTKIHVGGFQPFVSFQPVTFTATVSPMCCNNRGSVVFSNQTNNPLFGGQVDASGHVTIIWTGFAPGFPTIHAMYSGNTTFAASTSPFLGVQVVKAWAGTTLSSNKTNIIAGETVTFTTSVVALPPSVPDPGSFPGGIVSYYDGSTIIGSSFLSGGLTTFNTSSLLPGTHSIMASYSGNTFFEGSLSPQIITITVT